MNSELDWMLEERIWPKLRQYSSICLEGLMVIIKLSLCAM